MIFHFGKIPVGFKGFCIGFGIYEIGFLAIKRHVVVSDAVKFNHVFKTQIANGISFTGINPAVIAPRTLLATGVTTVAELRIWRSRSPSAQRLLSGRSPQRSMAGVI